MIRYLKNHSGLSLIATVLALLIFALFAAVAVSLVTTGSNIGLQEEQGQQAFDIAEAGLQKTLNYIIKQKDAACATSETCACTDADDYANTNPSLGAGSFNVATTPTLVTTPTTLSANITTVQTNIPVASTAGYAAGSGRIMIDREVIEYTSIGTTAADCNPVASPCFKDCTRGTTAASHVSGTKVGQKQCLITSRGTISTNPLASVQRQVSTVTELQNGWIAGGAGLPTENLNSIYCAATNNCWAVGDNGTIGRWNGTSWTDVTAALSPTTENLNSVYCTTSNNCWAVGDAGGVAAQRPLTIKWDDTAWSVQDNSALNINENLNSVYCTANNNCWAVGDDVGGPTDSLIINWDDTQWTYVDPSGNIDVTLYSVYMFSATNGWAVGENGRILRWNGANWANFASPTGQDLRSVYINPINSNNGWAVGFNGAIIQWNGANWANFASPTGQNLRSVYMLDTNGDGTLDNGWAMGDNGTILRWNTPVPNTWNVVASPTTENLKSVYMVSANDGWAVGDNGTILRWNGVSWSLWQQANATAIRWNSASWRDVSGPPPGGTLPAPPPSIDTLNSVSMLSYADGWAVGNRVGNNFTFLRWNGSQWINSSLTDATYRANLNSVFMISSRDGWTVGNVRNNNLTFLQWDGTNWIVRSFTTTDTEQNLNSVYMWDSDTDGLSNDGWAVGNCCDNSGRAWILRYQAGAWNKINAPAEATVNLNSVFMVSLNEVWMAGNDRGGGPNALILRWRNSAWTYTDPGVDTNLNSILMLDTDSDGDADDGWAVGNRINLGGGIFRFTILRWDGATSTWSALTSPAIPADSASNQNLNSVYCISPNECWAAGNNGAILSWNGSAWSRVTPPTGADLNEVYVIGTTIPSGQWKENYP